MNNHIDTNMADWTFFAYQVEEGLSSLAIYSFENVDWAADAISKVNLAPNVRSVPTGHFHRYNPTFTPEINESPAIAYTHTRVVLHSPPPSPLYRNRFAWIHQQCVSRHNESAPQPPLPTSEGGLIEQTPPT